MSKKTPGHRGRGRPPADDGIIDVVVVERLMSGRWATVIPTWTELHEAIVRLHEHGVSHRKIADRTGLSERNVLRHLNGQSRGVSAARSAELRELIDA